MLKAVVSAILTDDGFTRIKSPTTQNAHMTATDLLQWCSIPENQFPRQVFTSHLLQLFKKLLKAGSSKSQHKRKQIWRAIHKLRTSKSFRVKWVQFSESSTSLPPYPIFYQFISDSVFKTLIKAQFVVDECLHPGAQLWTSECSKICCRVHSAERSAIMPCVTMQ